MAAFRCIALCVLLLPASNFALRAQEDVERAHSSDTAADYARLTANLTALLDLAKKMKWSRAEVASNLCNGFSVGNLNVKCYNSSEEGLLWSGSAWSPSMVFKNGFLKTPTRPEQDPGDSAADWGQAIFDSIVGNTWAYGFHFSLNPVVASTFAAQHVGKSKSAEEQAEYECADAWDTECHKKILRQYQNKYGCPAVGSPVFEEDPNCWQKPCIRLEKLSDPDEGFEELCPNWGYAYLVKAEGIHVRVSTHHAVGKDYSAEEEVFVPIGVNGSEVLGAIPIYARKANGMKRIPALTNFDNNWKHFQKMKVNGLHTKDGKTASSGVGAFIHNPGYGGGDGEAEVEKELRMKGIANDLGPAVPKYD